MRSKHVTFDVLILGGGPAGCAAALALAGAGLQAKVVERARYDAPRLGETLPPSAAPLLQRLGVWERFMDDGHLPSPGNVSLWADEEPYENDFIFSPYGNGWHLDRRRFDELLATAAEHRGALVYRNTRVLACCQDSNGCWQIDVQSEGHAFRLAAPFLIDATGRAAWLAQRLGARRLTLDRLVGVVGLIQEQGCKSDTDTRMLLEATKCGWWYSARLSNGRITVAYMTDVDLLPQAPRDLHSFWEAQLRQTVHTRQRLTGQERPGTLRAVAADSYRMGSVAGENWLAVGDAAMAWDPLSAQGVSKALESGLMAASTVAEVLAGRTEALADYSAAVARGFEEYCRLRARYYGQVRRWPGSLFWERRQRSDVPGSDGIGNMPSMRDTKGLTPRMAETR